MTTSGFSLLAIVGDYNRYAIYRVTPRPGCSDASKYMVRDAEQLEDGMPAIVRQASTVRAALDGLVRDGDIRSVERTEVRR